jgi:Raf kinase inhibitor-like YbhB/YbcL family protein
MIIRIEAFTDSSYGVSIPKKYTCDGGKVSPGLTWDEVPQKTKSFALIMEDLDVPNRSNPLVTWVIYHIPGDVRVIKTGSLPTGAKVGLNDLGKTTYGAPCPEPGTYQHRYQVQLYALDTELMLPNGTVDKQALMKAMKGHILETATTVATCESYKKGKNRV